MHSSQRPKNGEPQPAPAIASGEQPPSKRDLTHWWRQFKRGNAKREEEVKAANEPGIFGVPLQTSIKYANVAISLFDEEGNSYIYGYVPIVVAKCGVFLKEKATDIEGIFRLAGSEKRIKELREAFNSPDRYGKGLDWTGYTVHDAANILRRYFNQLPEPIIPLDYYERFRNPLRAYMSSTSGPESTAQLSGDFDIDGVITIYQQIITEIPPLNRQLLLYILDLLAVFAAKSDQNKMTTHNLAAIFQPGILNHPKHDMAPEEYRLSQAVLIFLIENQDHFLVGMRGTAADEKTIQEVQSAANTQRSGSIPARSKTTAGVGRSSSNASAGADSVRRYGGVRRNVSVSSRGSRGSAVAQSPVTPSFGGGTVHRSNTLPSKKSPALPPNRFAKDSPSDPPTPATPPHTEPTEQVQPTQPAREIVASQESEAPVPAQIPQQAIENTQRELPKRELPQIAPPEVIAPSNESTPVATQVNLAETIVQTTPEKPKRMPTEPMTPVRTVGQSEAEVTSGTPRTLTNMFIRSPSQEPKDIRKPNKLQKRRATGSANPSAHSSTQSLSALIADPQAPPLPGNFQPASPGPLAGAVRDPFVPSTSEPIPSQTETLKPATSPNASFTDLSEAEQGDGYLAPTKTPEKDSKGRWFSSAKKENDKTYLQGDSALGLNSGAQRSVSSVSSAGGRGRRSFTEDRSQFTPDQPNQPLQPVQFAQPSQIPLSPEQPTNIGTPGKENEKKGPIGWMKGKLAERKEAKERAKSPPEQRFNTLSRSSLHLGRQRDDSQVDRSGRSMDIPRPQEPAQAPASTVTPSQAEKHT